MFADGRDKSAPLRLRNVCCDCLCTINIYSTNT